jgi:hypothetical protein
LVPGKPPEQIKDVRRNDFEQVAVNK